MQGKSEEQLKCITAYRSLQIDIYPALLSEVAKEFRKKIKLFYMYREGIEYRNVFSGKDAVVNIRNTHSKQLVLIFL